MIHAAGKITIATVCSGLLVFAAIFLLDIGRDHFQTVSAQTSGTATTSLTVRNLPPVWVVEAFEQNASATNTPINSGNQAIWEAEATNNMDYWLIVCSSNATPTPQAANSPAEQGDAGNAPSCGGGSIQWAVSGPTPSGNTATAATTTTNDIGNPFDESNEWYAWTCDDDTEDPRCSTVVQGENAGDPDAASPFVVNFRPVLNSVSNDGPTLPGDTITYTSDSSDPDTLRGNDEIVLHVCATNVFTNGECDTGETLATSTPGQTTNATSSFEIEIPTVSFTYEAYAFLVDEFNHEAINNFQSNFDVANATPEVNASSISINNGDDMELLQAQSTTTGFTLEFQVSDDNSCVAVDGSGASLGAGSEFEDTVVSLFRESVGSTTCDGTAGPFDENNCYTSAQADQWDFSCTPNVSSCTDSGLDTTDVTISYDCTFSLWYVADPTDGTTASEVEFPNESWFAAASSIDKDNATSTFTQGPTGVDVVSFLAFDLGNSDIPYGSLEPGEDTGNLPATTTIIATGNTGVDQDLEGSSMCSDFDVTGISTGTECSGDPEDTILPGNQRFGLDSTDTFSSATQLAAVGTPVNLAVNVFKPTQILNPSDGDIYWGIEVPADITLAGAYTGQNAFLGVISDATTWSP